MAYRADSRRGEISIIFKRQKISRGLLTDRRGEEAVVPCSGHLMPLTEASRLPSWSPGRAQIMHCLWSTTPALPMGDRVLIS